MEFASPQFQPAPNMLQAYVQGRMAPGVIQEQQQQLQGQQLNLDQLRLAMQKQHMLMGLAGRMAGQATGQPTPDGPSPGTQAYGAQAASGQPTGGIQNGPQADVSQPSPLGPEIDPRTRAAVGMLSPEALKGLGEAQEQSLKDAQLRARMPGSPLSVMQAFANNPNAGKAMMQNPQMMKNWPAVAQKFGYDPQDLSDINVRRVATLAANEQLASLGLPAMSMPQHYTQASGPLGSQYQTNDETGQTTQLKSEESLHPVVGGNGQPVLLPASQAAGKTPFNQSIFGAANMSDQALQFAADTYRTTGKMPTTMGRNPAMQAKVLEKVAADAAATGDTAGAIAARSGALKASGMALDQNQKLLTATSGYLSTMDKNLDNLTEIMGKVDSSGSPLINKALRAWQQGVAGDPDVAKYVTYLSSVQGEFAKLKSGSLGNTAASDSARNEAADVINKYMSNGQIAALREAMHQEGQNRVQSIQEQNQSLMQSMGQGAPGTPKASTSGPIGTGQSVKVNQFTVTRVK